jgi:hypothetical protein
VLMLAAAPGLKAAQQGKAQLDSPARRDARRVENLKEEVRHQLVTLALLQRV